MPVPASAHGPISAVIKTAIFAVCVNGTLTDLNWVDSFRQLYPGATDVGTFNGFEGTTTGDKIDYIGCPDNLEVLDTAIGHTNTNGRYPSDHFPVIATVRW